MSKKIPPEQLIAESQRAHLMLRELDPILSELKSSAISRLQGEQRGFTLTLEKAISIATEINVLEDLRRRLERPTVQARQMQEKLHNEKGA